MFPNFLSIINGDFRFFWPENIKDLIHLPLSWDSSLNTGIGRSGLDLLWINSYLNLTAFFSKFGLSWAWISLLFWLLPFALLSFFSAFFLFSYLVPNKRIYSIASGIIYLLNTYIVMIVAGGQLGVAISYSLAPFVLLAFMRTADKLSLKRSVSASLLLSVETLFDPRISLITLACVFLYFIFNLAPRDLFRKIIYIFFIPLVILLFTNGYWILPTIFFGISITPTTFTGLSGLKFLSFADFPHAFSLLHPNWPENIFGKTYFLRPEFLLLPIFAYGSLIFTKNKKFIYFIFLGLLGAFLAKGANPPFGEFYEWMFEHLPFFVSFRDPTKFYLLIAISYSILIPFTLSQLSRKIGKAKIVLPVIFLFFWIVISLPLFKSDSFKIVTVPQDYVSFKNLLVKDSSFSRTLWIPQWQRFGYFSDLHPAIGRGELSHTKITPQLLSDLSVKYIIVPYDSSSEIFLKDRSYDNTKYLQAISQAKKTPGFKEIGDFGKVKVFETDNFKDHFYIKGSSLKVSYKEIASTHYELSLPGVKKADVLVFSEGYDKNWQLSTGDSLIKSKPYDTILNSFRLEKDGSYTVSIYYKPQQLVNFGIVISIITVISLLIYLII